jgi:hypothetical protein|tara:strand:+ start:1067 stop:1423 length:357 start_codon:yes stop_codon:yes gene_type:complete
MVVVLTPKTEEEEIQHEKNCAELAKKLVPEYVSEEDKLKHNYTIELLYHFTCSSCKAWWSYASSPGQPIVDNRANIVVGDRLTLSDEIELHCPHCGQCENIKMKDGFLDLMTNTNQEG